MERQQRHVRDKGWFSAPELHEVMSAAPTKAQNEKIRQEISQREGRKVLEQNTDLIQSGRVQKNP